MVRASDARFHRGLTDGHAFVPQITTGMERLKSNTVSDVYTWFRRALEPALGMGEATAISREVFFRKFGLRADELVLKAGNRMRESDIVTLMRVRKRLLHGEPLQYVLGVTRFLEYDIYVRPGVLIPRQETEGLVLWVEKTLQNMPKGSNGRIKIFDACTGTGCIAIALAKSLPDADVFGCDKGHEVLQVAKHNALINSVEVHLFTWDVLSGPANHFISGSLDCMVSNPPYVRHSELRHMAANVRDHEPHAALFVPDNDPLIYYRALLANGSKWLRKGGYVFFEINEAMGDELAGLVRSLGYSDVSLKKDIHGRQRYIRARWKG